MNNNEDTEVILGRPGNNLKMGLVGLPNVGKSSLFNLISDLQVPAENRSFCTIEPNRARVPVPDKRFNYLCEHWHPASEVAASLTVLDIAGLVAGAHEGKGLGNDFLSHIGEVDGIFHVVRAFKDKDVSHYEGEVDPIRDLEIISTELRMKDIQRLENSILPPLQKLVDRGIDKNAPVELETAQKVYELLQDGNEIRRMQWSAREVDWLNHHLFLTAKPMVFLVNVSAKDYRRGKNKWFDPITEWVQNNSPGSSILPFSVAYEESLKHGEVKEEEDVKVRKSVLSKIINSGYKCLNLIHFFTVGEDEVRCWTVQKGRLAPQAAGVIHTDFQKGFQSADVYSYKDFKKLGSVDEVRAQGKLRMQGRNYVVKDGDIIFFKINISKKKK